MKNKESAEIIEEVYEPFLIQQEFIPPEAGCPRGGAKATLSHPRKWVVFSFEKYHDFIRARSKGRRVFSKVLGSTIKVEPPLSKSILNWLWIQLNWIA